MFHKRALEKISRLLKVFSGKDPRYRGAVSSWEDFSRLPVSGREDLKAFCDRNVIEGAVNFTATSGSTSSRLFIAHSREAYGAHQQRLVRLYHALGITRGKVCLNLCSYELNSGGRLMESALKAAGAGVIPLGPLNSPEKIREACILVRQLRPAVVNAYTNQLFDLFSVLGREHSIKTCLVNGELMWPDYRRRMQEMGGVRIHDHYGAMEISGLAAALHPDDEYMKVFAQGLLLEVLTDSGQAARTGTGDLLVTDVNNFCMPVVRYRLGDRVELKRHKGSLGIKILGRTAESLLVNGVVVMKKELIRTVTDALGHPNFFVIVDKDSQYYGDRLMINVAGGSLKTLKAMPDVVIKTLGLDHCVVARNHQGVIPRTSNGKIRYFVAANKEHEKI